MELAQAIPVLSLAAMVAGLFLLHVFRGPKEQDALLRKEVDEIRRDLDQQRQAHYALAERVARDYHDKAEVREIVTQIHSRITEILQRLDGREFRNVPRGS